VLSLGGGGKPENMEELAGAPSVVEFAPQLELLKRAALCITHAGFEYGAGVSFKGRAYGGDSNHQRLPRGLQPELNGRELERWFRCLS
jgi:hypothetical protein